tara:strand:+ start:141 stop:551 length:411 start_codon:yes stop_codon:yes gene_type:complete
MEEIIFNYPINISCTEGDLALWADTSAQGGFTISGEYHIIGVITDIISPNPTPVTYNGVTYAAGTVVIITVDTSGYEAPWGWSVYGDTSKYIFFAKNNLIEVNAITGYFAKAKFNNNSTKIAELYATACDVEESSE